LEWFVVSLAGKRNPNTINNAECKRYYHLPIA
jgi:hypothetical protein